MNESNRRLLRRILLITVCIAGASLMAPAHAQSRGEPSCPCFTSDSIDATMLSLWGVLLDEGEDPVPRNEENYCSGLSGKGIHRLELEMVIYTTSVVTGLPLSNAGFASGFSEEPYGTCEVGIERVNDQGIFDNFRFKIGGAAATAEGESLTVGQVAACKKEIVNSNTFKVFCLDILEPLED